MRSLTPFHSLVMLLALGLAGLGLSLIWPQGGIGQDPWKLRFYTWNPSDSTSVHIPDMQAHIAHLDSIAKADSLQRLNDTVHVHRTNTLTSLQFKDNNSIPFHAFFNSLDSAHTKNVDVFHFGDSQIECDRMTQILRLQMQTTFGGYGPGLISPVPLVATSHIVQSQSPEWKRCTAYGYQDSKVKHNVYGAMCSFGRFDCGTKDSTEASIELSPTRFGDARNKTYHVARIYYRCPEGSASLRVECDGALVWHGVLSQTTDVVKTEINFPQTPNKLKLVFRAMQSPEVHGIQLEETTGVSVSNIALRGSDGFLFTRTHLPAMKQTFAAENPQLIILQFGGNSIPYLKSAAHAQQCAEQMGNQIRTLRQAAPLAAILIVGPSDMSTSIDGVMQSFPYISAYNDALKSKAFELNCGFWDMYAVMGGRNSMIGWVNHQPPYAGPDYTHFTPLGARKMGEFLVKAILDEYQNWKIAKSAM
jgi:lysophospholipase L1-like esterase